MKESYWGYWIVVLGIFIIGVMLLIQNVTSSNTEEYYDLKTITSQAMEDAVDYAYYRKYGELKINKEKFEENFIRRFADVASATGEYDIVFTAIYEAPPKVSVEVSTKTAKYVVGSESTGFDVVNRNTIILELNTSVEKEK